MTFKDVLNGRNVNGEIYRCDVKRFFGWSLSKNKVEEIHRTLMEIVREDR